MEAHLSPPKATPGRRRQDRSNGKSAGQKAYASENDAVSYAANHHMMPRTPDKTGYAAAMHANGNNTQVSSKQRSRSTKFKGKNLPTSPEVNQQNDESPPQRSPVSKQKSSTAFAGATFHASPAPSALPLPSFLAKSLSDSPIPSHPKNLVQEPSPPATDTEVPTPYRPSANKNHESPLDFMFRAHREEKERQRQDPGTRSPARFFDPSASPSAATLSQNRRTQQTRQSFSGTDTFELDGNPGQSMGPAFSTPYQDRIRAARNNVPSHGNPRQIPTTADEDPTEALKKFLFGGKPPTSSALPSAATSSISTGPRKHADSLTNSQVDGSGYGGTSSNLQAMENDLRRILKLDMVPESAPTERRLFTR